MTDSEAIRDIIDRYESEEEEFLRELEEMREQISGGEGRETDEESIPQDPPQPILSVLCSLVDEIGTLRTENRRLKTRLTIPRSKGLAERVSSLLDSQRLLPRLRRPPTASHAEVRVGARERLASPAKDCLTTSTFSTDVSRCSRVARRPPLVEPEISDSDLDEEHLFSEPDCSRSPSSLQRGRPSSRRGDSRMSTSEYSASSASSRDPSETILSSRSSFLELIGLRKRKEHVRGSCSQLKACSKRVSHWEDDSTSAVESTPNLRDDRARLAIKIKNRASARFANDDSEDSEDQREKRKSTSFLSVHPHKELDRQANHILRVDRETRLRHEKDSARAEVEQFKSRNNRLVDQLREKSATCSRLQTDIREIESELSTLRQRVTLSAYVDQLTLSERYALPGCRALERVEERVRQMESDLQGIKIHAYNQQQQAVKSASDSRAVHRQAMEQVERLQRENIQLLQKRLIDTPPSDPHALRRLEQLPTFDALYTFTMGVVRKLCEVRWQEMEARVECGRLEMDVVGAESELLVTHTQLERERIRAARAGARRRRHSFHAVDSGERAVRAELECLLPFRLHANRVEHARRIAKRQKSLDQKERNIETELLRLFGHAKTLAATVESTASRSDGASRIENMKREMGARATKVARHPSARLRDRAAREVELRRPISLVETEERRWNHQPPQPPQERRRPDRHTVLCSLQDVHSPSTRSPLSTPIATRRSVHITTRNNPTRVYDVVESVNERAEMAGSPVQARITPARPRLQRAQPVGTRIRQPSAGRYADKAREERAERAEVRAERTRPVLERSRTLEGPHPSERQERVERLSVIQRDPPPVPSAPPRFSPLDESRIPKKSWLEKIKQYSKK